MPVNLAKGQKVDLTKGNPGLSKIIVGLGWDTNKYDGGADFDLDASAFLCGDSILVCPVFDEGAANVAVTLPDLGCSWRLRGAGPLYPPGEELIVPCLPEDDPVWFERG